MGYTRFLEWDFHKRELPMGSYSYDAGAKVGTVTRLGIIFYFESTYIQNSLEPHVFSPAAPSFRSGGV